VKVILLLAATTALAQPGPRGGPPADPPPYRPDQPVQPRTPTLERRAGPQELPEALPRLTPQEEAQVDRILNVWQQRSAGVKTFECSFKRWEYDPVFPRPDPDAPRDAPTFEEIGTIKYAAPDKGMFRVDKSVENGKIVAIAPGRAEHWICDGTSIYQYDQIKKQVIEQRLPPELQGKAIADGPLPFLFGAKAQSLKQRYVIRITTPAEVQGQQTWLEAFPRFQADAANFRRAELILTNQNMTPFALHLVEPNGKKRTSYQFYEIVTNDPLRFFKGDPFRPTTPLGWKRILDEPRAAQGGRVPPPARK
jgi:TIGR03009 family protein